MKRTRYALLAVLALSLAAAAQPPRFTGGKVETSSAAGGLQAAVKQAIGGEQGVVWIAYAVPIVNESKPRSICCGNYSSGEGQMCCGGCRLESGDGYYSGKNSDCMQIEAPTSVDILLRYSGGQLTRIRAMTPGCAVDANGVTIHWLNDVQPGQSVALLSTAALDTAQTNQVMNGATMAIALHGDSSADAALNKLVAPDLPLKTREQASFWIANERGKTGFATLQRLAREDKDDRLRQQVAFHLTLTKEPEALPELIRMAHTDADSKVRGQALFWMAQKAGKKVAGEITNAIENDPDTEVKRRAVFALTQIPDNDGVPKLIEVARNNRNPAVRKQAIFWLGQSHDPRALAFIEDVLTR